MFLPRLVHFKKYALPGLSSSRWSSCQSWWRLWNEETRLKILYEQISFCLSLKMDLSRPLFPGLFYRHFRAIQYSWQWTLVSINFVDNQIQTADIMCWKQLLYQLRHNNCPYFLFLISFWSIFWKVHSSFKRLFSRPSMNRCCNISSSCSTVTSLKTLFAVFIN